MGLNIGPTSSCFSFFFSWAALLYLVKSIILDYMHKGASYDNDQVIWGEKIPTNKGASLSLLGKVFKVRSGEESRS